jgi:transposase
LPAHLPRERVVHAPACACPACGSTRLTRLGEDEREVLDYVPSHFKVVVHIRPRMSCRACETNTQVPAPSLPIARGRPGASLLAHVLVAKYCDHAPLYRQSAIYARAGVELERSTLADWVGQAAFLLEPLAAAITRHVRAGVTLHADDTPVPVLDPGRGKTKTGRLWVLVRDERPWGGPAPPAVSYLYSPDRKGEHARTLLAGCRGFLHADGYAGFNGLYEPDASGTAPLVEVACWAHSRRKLFDVHATTGSAIAKGLQRIATLFEVEARINGHDPERRQAMRQERSLPLLAELKDSLNDALGRISRKSSLAVAIRYSLSRWPALCRFAHDGRGDDQQRGRARHSAPGSGKEELSVRRLGQWRPARRDPLHLDPDCDPQRPRPGGLSARRPGPDRRAPDQPDRRPAPLGLGHLPAHRRGCLTRPLAVKPFPPRRSPDAYDHPTRSGPRRDNFRTSDGSVPLLSFPIP